MRCQISADKPKTMFSYLTHLYETSFIELTLFIPLYLHIVNFSTYTHTKIRTAIDKHSIICYNPTKGGVHMKKLISLLMCIPALLGLTQLTACSGDAKRFNEIMSMSDPFDLVIELGSYLCEKCEYGDRTDKLSEAERVIFVIREVEAEVNNGGFSQYFFNSSGAFAGEIVSAFETVGAHEIAAICKKAVESFGVPIPVDRQARFDMLEEYETEEVSEILWECDKAFYSVTEDYMKMQYDYIMAHRDEFTH